MKLPITAFVTHSSVINCITNSEGFNVLVCLFNHKSKCATLTNDCHYTIHLHKHL